MPISSEQLGQRALNTYTGKKFELSNGFVATIPSMPVGSISERFLEYQDKFKKTKDMATKKGMILMNELMWAILALNYNVTVEDVDGLFTLNNMNGIMDWFFSGVDSDMGKSSHQTNFSQPSHQGVDTNSLLG